MSDRDQGGRLGMGDAAIAVDAAAGAVALRDGRFRRLMGWDEALLLGFRRFHTPWLTAIARSLTAMGDGKTWAMVGVACLATCSARGTQLGLRLGAATGIATLLSQALKRSLTRPRPNIAIEGFEPLAANPDRFSFPSGHTAAAVGVAVAFAGEPYGLGAGALLLSVGIGLSRIYLGAHYPLDVTAGAVLGGFAGVAARLLVS
jgi:undecaprenyl-diphosphatase